MEMRYCQFCKEVTEWRIFIYRDGFFGICSALFDLIMGIITCGLWWIAKPSRCTKCFNYNNKDFYVNLK